MASSAQGKGSVKTREWAKHLRPFGKKVQQSLVREDGKKQALETEDYVDYTIYLGEWTEFEEEDCEEFGEDS